MLVVPRVPEFFTIGGFGGGPWKCGAPGSLSSPRGLSWTTKPGPTARASGNTHPGHVWNGQKEGKCEGQAPKGYASSPEAIHHAVPHHQVNTACRHQNSTPTMCRQRCPRAATILHQRSPRRPATAPPTRCGHNAAPNAARRTNSVPNLAANSAST